MLSKETAENNRQCDKYLGAEVFNPLHIVQKASA